jgi:hypothetical protein
MKPHPSLLKDMTWPAVIISVVFALSGVFYAQNSTAGHHEGHHGDSGAKSGQSSSSKQGSSSQEGAKHKKHGGAASGQGSSGQSGSSSATVTESERTGVTGNDPSGGRSETSGQERGPSGY